MVVVMNRYHKSFLGMMEQNKDGEWVNYWEVSEELDVRKEKFRERLNKVSDERDTARHLLKCTEDEVTKLQLELKAGKIILSMLGILWVAYALNDAIPYIILYAN